jgi:hypothetical protein
MVQVLAVLVGEVLRTPRQVADVVDGGHERPAKGRIPFRRPGDQRIGDAGDEPTQLRERWNGERRDGVARRAGGLREVGRRRPVADVIEDDGAEPVECLRRLFGE